MKKVLRVIAVEPIAVESTTEPKPKEKDNAVYKAGLNIAHYRGMLIKGMIDGGIPVSDAEYLANQIVIRMAGERI